MSVYHGFEYMDHPQYQFGDKKYIVDPWQGMMVKKDISAALEFIGKCENMIFLTVHDVVSSCDDIFCSWNPLGAFCGYLLF